MEIFLYVYGTLINNGTIHLPASCIFNYGTTTNNGRIWVDGGIIYNFSGSTINNNSGGSLLLDGGEFYNYSGGTLNNNVGATIYNYGYNLFENYSTFNQLGSFNNANGSGTCGTGTIRGTVSFTVTGHSCPPPL